jgi:pilus assembly protein Flp/PilA
LTQQGSPATVPHRLLSGARDLVFGLEIFEERRYQTHMQFLTALINLVRRDDEGQGLAEYALILALIAIVAIIALIFLGTQVSGILSTVGASV